MTRQNISQEANVRAEILANVIFSPADLTFGERGRVGCNSSQYKLEWSANAHFPAT